MKIKIDQDGDLWIKRAGRWVIQICPHHAGHCGDLCPLFRGPFERDELITGIGFGKHIVFICDGVILSSGEPVVDERKQNE
jgi:hypothetical protein